MTENQKGGVDIREYVKMYTSEDAVPETNGTTSSELTGIQVKFEVEDPEYEQGVESSTVSAGLLRSFQAPQVIASSQSAAEWTGTSSAIRTELRKMMEDKSLDSSTATQNVQTVIENLLKKNENLLAQNDAMGYKPYSRRGRPALEGSRGKDSVFPGSGQSVTFSAGTQTQGRITGIGTRQYSQLDNTTATAQLGQLMRPKSPTRRCAVQERDKSHFNLALMESKVGCKEGEQIFKVQEHEMVCAISSQTKFLNKEGRLVSSVDISYYWCNFCNYSTTNKTFLMQHVMEHRFHCKHCRYQSFSRADVIHHSVHTHPGFQDTASITQYCTLLPDYLRVHNPSEAQLDQRRKRKDPPPDDGDEPSAKVSKNKVDKNMVQKSYLADYDLFNVSVEELKEKAEEEGGSATSVETGSKTSSASSSGTVLSSPADPGSQTTSMVSSLVSQPVSAVAQSSVSSVSQPVITQVFSASTLPPTLAPAMAASGTSQASPHASSSSPTPATPFYPNSVGAGAMQQMRSNLYWSCGYCSFTSTTQSGIKEHSVMQHSGKPHRYVALIKSEGGESTPPPTGNCTGEQASESEVTLETDKSPEPLATDADDKEELDEPPVLVKLEPMDQEDASVPIRVRFPTPRIQPKDPTTLKCIHCNHTSRSLGPLRNHILNRHKGKCLVGVGGVSSRVFMCSRADCTFRSSSGQTFLSHSRECTPWLVSDEPVANNLKKCLEATTRIAEEAEAALSSPATVSGPSATPSSQVSYDLFSCIYCKSQISWSKKQTKRHVLQCHSSKCLVMRDVKAHRNRKRSCVFFCRWCPWEGRTKEEHNVHSLLCPPAPDDSRSAEILLDGGVCLPDNSALENCEDTGENADRKIVTGSDDDDDDDLGPPDITHDKDNNDRLWSGCAKSSHHTADGSGLQCSQSTAEARSRCKTFLSDGVPQLYISDPNVIDSDDSDEFPQSNSSGPFIDSCDEHSNQRNLRNRSKSGTKSDTMLHYYDKHKKVKPFQSKSAQFFSSTKRKLPKRKMTIVQCFLCGFETDALRSLKLHMQDSHDQHVSFSFRSVYHSALHLKCRFFVCPLLDCPVYRYNEADVVSHYRQCHASHSHIYLDPSYCPAPMKFQQRANLYQGSKTRKLRQPRLGVSSPVGRKLASAEPEGQYLCLYCDQYHYSNTISDMKAHYLAAHPSMAIIVRDVVAFRNKKMSRVSVCEDIHCDFSAYISRRLEEHTATVHRDRSKGEGAGQVLQCTSCGWVTSDNSLLVHMHLTTVHAGDDRATMVTINCDD